MYAMVVLWMDKEEAPFCSVPTRPCGTRTLGMLAEKRQANHLWVVTEEIRNVSLVPEMDNLVFCLEYRRVRPGAAG